MTDSEKHSTGRGGAGNIGKGEGVYTAGDIVREGPAGESGRIGQADYSAGRGGSGNIGHESQPGKTNGSLPPLASDYVPESATVGSHQSDFHTGRGGEGNIHRAKYGGHSKPQKEHGEGHGLVEKAKHAVGLDKHHSEVDTK